MKRLFVVLSIFVALSIVGLVLASPVRQVAFPQTGILDDFNRPDGGLGANWTRHPDSAGSLSISSNGVVNENDPDSGGSDYWNIQFGETQEVYFTITEIPSDTNSVTLYSNLNLDTYDSYSLVIFRNDSDGDFIRCGTDTSTDYPINFQIGDGFGMRVLSTTVEVFQKPVGGSWTLVGIKDKGISMLGPGYAGIAIATAGGKIDNFGGGTIIIESPTPTPTVTPTGGITSSIPYVVIPIPGGQAQPAIYVIYSLTIGEIIIASILLLLVLVIAGRWLYDVAMDVFQVRNAAIGSWVSRKLYKRWINRMVE